jgi:tRNA C32,U32 (ribose-2'-O)-methylase TrmJ
MRNIKAMFNRFPLTEQDIRTLHGIMKSIERSGKAIDHADESDQA